MNTNRFRCIILLYLISIVHGNQDDCPVSRKCECRRSTQREGPDWVKIKCGDGEKVSTLEELDLLNIANEIVQLNLSNNHLTVFLPKVQLVALQKLDISKNRLAVLQNNQFVEVPNLRRLDISGNNIKHIEPFAFANLQHLERLKLNQNQIATISKGTFKPLTSLKQLDISNNPLTCDCDLLWLLDWAQKMSVKLVSNPKCTSPSTFKGFAFKKLKIGVDIHCKSPAGNQITPVIDLRPAQNQVVFEGDSLKMNCRAPSIVHMSGSFDPHSTPQLEWTWLDSNPRHHFSDVYVKNHFSPDTGLMDSSLYISKLVRNHTGIWNCQLTSNHGNHSKGLMVIVISDETRYCPVEVTVNNKGTYTWPRTVVNYTVSVACEAIQLNEEEAVQRVSYFCGEDGRWRGLNTSACAYVSETTKIFQQFSKVNLSLTKANVLESARHFKNQTTDLKVFKDVMDLIYVVRTLENYLAFLELEKELGGILMDISNNLMRLPADYLNEADQQDGSCRKLVRSIEKLSGHTASSFLHKSNIATEEFPVKQASFAGMTCTWYSHTKNDSERYFYCVSSNRSNLSGMQDRDIEVSLQVPASLFYQLREQDVYLGKDTQHLLVTMFRNNKLFPLGKDQNGRKSVTSAVVGVKLANVTMLNLTDPVYVMMKTPEFLSYDLVQQPNPVWWDPNANNGSGNWTSSGCRLSHEVRDHVVFFCRQLGYYSLMQDLPYPSGVETVARFRFSHPAIYVGGFTLMLFLLVSIVTYLFCYTSIQMPKKAKHAVVNVWIAVFLLCFMYVSGVYQTEDVKVCQSVGLMLHYFTLSSLLWMCVGVNYMYKRLTKNDAIELQDDELPSDQPIQKPILGLYLVGWGVALIICGISGAVNMKEYASPTHCFLTTGPALSALFVPFAILLAFLCIFFLLIRCAIYNVDANGHLSEGTQATENMDLDLLEPNFPDTRSVRTNSTKTASSEAEDPEHAPSTQLKAYVVFLLLYLITWTSCALATISPMKMFPYEEDVFSVTFAVSATALGAFTLFFYCVARNDVRTEWVVMFRSVKRSRNVSPGNVQQIQPMPLAPASGPLVQDLVASRSSSRSSNRTKTTSHTSNILKAAADLNGSTRTDGCGGAKINNVNLVVLHRQQYRTVSVVPNLIENPTSSAEMFYNPHQSTVARKFFKKQKRNMMKRNNLGAVRVREVNSDSASVLSYSRQAKNGVNGNIFGTKGKVNNTNIHVEHIRRTKHRNPNILSDSCEEYDRMNEIPVEKLVMNAERLRKRDTTKHKPKKTQNTPPTRSVDNNMRSVSQQCTLEYSSETISDSILDKSPDNKPKTPDLLLHPKTENYETSEVSFSVAASTGSGRIYVNPSHEILFSKSAQSRTSSVSASELDELYQQIRRGPRGARKRSPCLSDSEIASCASDVRYARRRVCSSSGNVSDKVETTV